MRRYWSYNVLVFLGALLICLPCRAVVTSFDDSKAVKWGKSKNFQSVGFLIVSFEDGQAQLGTGILVSPSIVLTVAHGIRGGRQPITRGIFNLHPNGKEFSEDYSFRNIVGVLPHGQCQVEVDGTCNGMDVALVQLDRPISDVEPALLYAGDKKFEHYTGYTVGYGGSGNHREGMVMVGETAKLNIKRAAFIPATTTDEGIKLTYSHTSYKAFASFENDEKVPYLGVPCSGDSGGPWVAKIDEKLVVAGMMQELQRIELGESAIQTAVWLSISPLVPWIKRNVENITRGQETIRTLVGEATSTGKEPKEGKQSAPHEKKVGP